MRREVDIGFVQLSCLLVLQCVAITGLGFRRGSYQCVCRRGFYFPDTRAAHRAFNGSHIEEEYEKLQLVSERIIKAATL